MSKHETATRRDTFANRPEGRIRRDERRNARPIGLKAGFAAMNAATRAPQSRLSPLWRRCREGETMKVFILSAEHFSVPGLVLQAHATQASAVAEAVDLVKAMLKDCEYPHRFKAGIAATNWQDAVEWLQGVHGAAHCYVEIAEADLHGAPADPVRDAAPDMLAALKAIVARHDGVFDAPELATFGPLTTKAEDIVRIAQTAILKAEGAA